MMLKSRWPAAINRPLLALGQLFFLGFASTGAQAVFLQDATAPYLVSMEADHYSAKTPLSGHDWLAVTTYAGYSGDAAMQSLPQDGFGVEYGEDIVGLSPRLDFQVQFTQTGTHYVWIRGLGPSGRSDSVHLGLDGAPAPSAAKLVLKPLNNWVWANKTTSGAVATLSIPSPGSHTVNVWLRESGAAVDKLVLTTSSSYAPSDLGPAESGGGGGGPPVTTPSPSGLSHYWSLDEASGPLYRDSVSSATASCSACPAAGAGLINTAQTFNGVNIGLSVAAEPSLNWSATGRFSLEAWVNTANCTGRRTLLGRFDPASQLRWRLGCTDGKAAFYLRDAANAGTALELIGTRSIADGAWHHLAAVRDSVTNENRLYVDGVLDGTLAVSYASGFESVSAPLTIGFLNDPGDPGFFAGWLDEVAIHERVLSENLIQRHYNDGRVGLRRGYLGCTGAPVRIMPLGDSLTRRQGYRRVLYPDLVRAGYSVDFLGSRADGNVSYDPNHEGHSGYTPADIASYLPSWLNLNPPELILLHIGTNQLDVPGVERILDLIDAANPATTVVLARIINHAHPIAEVSAFNNAITALAQARVAAGDKILMVDMEPALNYQTDFTLPGGGYDDLHPNNSGFAKMAKVWFRGLQSLLPACVPVQPWVSSKPVITAKAGVLYTYQVEAAGNPLPTFSLQSAPPGMTIHPDTGLLEWTPATPGSVSVKLGVQNTQGSATHKFTIKVN